MIDSCGFLNEDFTCGRVIAVMEVMLRLGLFMDYGKNICKCLNVSRSRDFLFMWKVIGY